MFGISKFFDVADAWYARHEGQIDAAFAVLIIWGIVMTAIFWCVAKVREAKNEKSDEK